MANVCSMSFSVRNGPLRASEAWYHSRTISLSGVESVLPSLCDTKQMGYCAFRSVKDQPGISKKSSESSSRLFMIDASSLRESELKLARGMSAGGIR